MNIETIYEMAKQAIIYYPESVGQPDTFIVVEFGLEQALATETLNVNVCDIDSPFFWSRLHQKNGASKTKPVWQFPLVAAYEVSGVTQNPFSKMIDNATIEICVLDKKGDPSKLDCSAVAGRSVNRILIDARNTLQRIMQFIGQCVIVNDIGNGTKVVAHSDQVPALVIDGKISGNYTTQQPAFTRTQLAELDAVGIPALNVYGYKYRVSLSLTPCMPFVPDFSAPYSPADPQPCNC